MNDRRSMVHRKPRDEDAAEDNVWVCEKMCCDDSFGPEKCVVMTLFRPRAISILLVAAAQRAWPSVRVGPVLDVMICRATAAAHCSLYKMTAEIHASQCSHLAYSRGHCPRRRAVVFMPL
jgi:hypothetical protein